MASASTPASIRAASVMSPLMPLKQSKWATLTGESYGSILPGLTLSPTSHTTGPSTQAEASGRASRNGFRSKRRGWSPLRYRRDEPRLARPRLRAFLYSFIQPLSDFTRGRSGRRRKTRRSRAWRGLFEL